MSNALEVLEGARDQSSDEEIYYKILTTAWGSNPTTSSVKCYDVTLQNKDVTSTVFPTNTPTESGDYVNLSPLKSLTKNHQYRIEVKFTADSNVLECFFLINCVM